MGAGLQRAKAAAKATRTTQREFDIHEIECALDFMRQRKPVVWSALRLAIDRLEADEKGVSSR